MFDEDVSIVLLPDTARTWTNSAQGEIRFQVKWEGYNRPSDMTWEPEENLAYVCAVPSLTSENH